MWDLPGPGMEPWSPALVGGFFTTEPPGKPLKEIQDMQILWMSSWLVILICLILPIRMVNVLLQYTPPTDVSKSFEIPGSQERNLRTPVKKKDGHKVSQRQLRILTGHYFSYSASPKHSELGSWCVVKHSHISRVPLWHPVTSATGARRLELESGVLPNRMVTAWAQERPIEFSLQTSPQFKRVQNVWLKL